MRGEAAYYIRSLLCGYRSQLVLDFVAGIETISAMDPTQRQALIQEAKALKKGTAENAARIGQISLDLGLGTEKEYRDVLGMSKSYISICRRLATDPNNYREDWCNKPDNYPARYACLC